MCTLLDLQLFKIWTLDLPIHLPSAMQLDLLPIYTRDNVQSYFAQGSIEISLFAIICKTEVRINIAPKEY